MYKWFVVLFIYLCVLSGLLSLFVFSEDEMRDPGRVMVSDFENK